MLRFLAKFQYVLPQLLLTKIIGKVAKCENNLFKNIFIYFFIKIYKVNLQEAERKTVEEYTHFNDFFTRKLDFTVRQFDPCASSPNPVSPVDGTVLTMGDISQNTLLQAKGHSYSLDDLLATKLFQAEHPGYDTSIFQNGSYITIYLSPQDYHRVHMPVTGQLQSMSYVPGKLFSVSPTSCAAIKNIFASNERVINIFKTEHGYIAVILVGAMLVGSIATNWHGEITPPHGKQNQFLKTYQDQQMNLNKGDDLGYFQMGSTVILLFSEKLDFNTSLLNQQIKLGDQITN